MNLRKDKECKWDNVLSREITEHAYKKMEILLLEKLIRELLMLNGKKLLVQEPILMLMLEV
jgi:hypothetical protein